MKSELRKRLTHIRSAIPYEQILEKSQRITDKLQHLDEYEIATAVMFYVSYDNEVYTHKLIKEVLKAKTKEAIVPLTDVLNRKLLPVKIESWSELSPGAYNILEPKNKQNVADVNTIDLVLLPGIAFDKRGNRIGHGAGYYDRLLGKYLHAKRAGLAFDFQIVDTIPVEKHDVAIDIIITENRIIKCQDKF
ncbi:5-formyltetrahydrofolate cyclo-ligase [Thermoplasmatales archaeon SCGC AB-539-N05]|nr:5-formyltetrahydrofolate cyclo-ligase [Thermoplasmatales archaeon SCGC AB-539-N05]